MSELTSILGTPFQLMHNGKNYAISLIKLGVRAEYERLLAAKARADLRLRKAGMSKAGYDRELKEIGQKELAGEYSFLSPTGTGALRTAWGLKTLFGLLMTDLPQDERDLVIEEHEDELLSMLDGILQESFPRLVKKGKEQSHDA